jgi:hypothetical protein
MSWDTNLRPWSTRRSEPNLLERRRRRAAAVLATGLMLPLAALLAPAATATASAAAAPRPAALSLTTDLDSSYCVVLRSGGAECWGYNLDGDLGNGGDETASYVPVAVEGVSGATALASDDENSYCAILHSGHVECWGNNDDGALGNGSSKRSSNVAVRVPNLSTATGIWGGDSSYCAVLRSGGAECWGNNANDALGSGGSKKFSGTPAGVRGLKDARSLAAGFDGYCALLGSGGAQCWGYNYEGGLGDGSGGKASNVAVTVKGLAGALSLSSTDGSYCAVLRSGGADCWGSNANGALGDGGTGQSSNVPVAVRGLAGAAALAGGVDSYCAKLHSGTVSCWGENFEGALGGGAALVGKMESDIPVRVIGLTSVTSLAAGYGTYCTTLQTGGAECWGWNSYGPGTSGLSLQSDVPVVERGVTQATSVVIGNGSYCALTQSGGADCWGGNSQGDLGAGGHEPYLTIAVAVKNLG